MIGLILLFLTAYLLLVLLASASVVWQIGHPRRKTYAVALAIGMPTDPAEFGLAGQEATFNLPDNHTSPGWIITGNNPAGPTVVVLHGHSDSSYGALRFAKQLAPYAAHLVVFDWPGHGHCDAKWMTCGLREPADVQAVIAGLPDEIRNKPLVLFGYSLGGQIAIKTAANHPRFVGVIVDGPYRRWDTPIRQKFKIYRVPAFALIHMVGAAFWLSGMIRNFDRAQYAARLKCPLLVLHGSDDRICPIHEGKELSEHAPDSTFVAIVGGRHNRLFEYDPETYHAALKTFFQSISG